MPGLDTTGPMGQGSQTGRKQGRCNAAANEQQLSNFGRRGGGRGLKNRNMKAEDTVQAGWGRGKRRGCGRGYGRLEH